MNPPLLDPGNFGISLYSRSGCQRWPLCGRVRPWHAVVAVRTAPTRQSRQERSCGVWETTIGKPHTATPLVGFDVQRAQVDGVTVVIGLDLAAVASVPFAAGMALLKRDRVPLPPELVELAQLLDQARRAQAVTRAGGPALREETMASTPRRLVSVGAVASHLGVGEHAVRARLRRGTLSGRKTEDGRWLVEMEDIECESPHGRSPSRSTSS